jgi:D-arabinose 1-dehydrogenase-like Zn-dependent alcohol dehydrogenase
MDLDYQALMGRLVNLVYGIVVYPLGILNLFWIAPTVAVLRWVWRFLKRETNVKGKAVVITGASSGIGEVSIPLSTELMSFLFEHEL